METVTKFIQLIAPKLYVDQVENRCDDTKMRAVATSGNAFSYFPCALVGDRAEETSNDQISSDRVIVENYFGRLNVLWRITTDKYRWNESLYDDVFRLSVALTNFHVSISPLREQNGLKIKEKRRLAQEKYRAKKRRRRSTEVGDLGEKTTLARTH
uniref:DDE Tnp4 domain-containing protein n=1 Tax=Phytophthora ramorum TaxID=164328 RepID=H3H7X7_PHYRM